MVYDVQMHNFSCCALGLLGPNSIYQHFQLKTEPKHV